MGRRVLAFVLALAVAGVMLPSFTAPAAAQGFFDRLFGGPRYQRFKPPAELGNRPGPAPQVIGEPAAPAIPVKPKNLDARQVLVIGDFLGAALAAGLDQTFAEDPSVAVVDKTSGSSGLVRDDHYDWNKQLIELLNEIHPAAVVVLIGTNDRQQFRLESGRLQLRTPEWETLYQARIQGIAATLRTYGQPYFWVSAPPLKDAAASADLAYFNNFYKTGVESAGGHFVDIWNGFVDAEGRFTRRGPDVEGQVVTLRASDGINFNRAGRYKLAYYVEREIRRSGALGGVAGDLLASTTAGDRIEVGPDGERIWVGPVLSLSAPPAGAALVLAGGPSAAAEVDADASSPGYRLVVKGDALPTVAGRVDDYSWPPARHSVAAIDIQPPREAPSVAVIRDGIPIPPRKPVIGPQAQAEPATTPATR